MTQTNSTRPYLPLVIISVAMHVSILIYVFVLYFLSSQRGDWTMGWRVFPEQQTLFFVLTGLGLAEFCIALMLPKFYLKESGGRPLDPTMSGGPGIFLNFEPLTLRVHQLTILRMAIAEAVAIFGFVLAFMNRSLALAIPYCAVGLILQFLVGPIWGKIAASRPQA